MTKINEQYMDIKFKQTCTFLRVGGRIAMINCLSRFIIHFGTNLGATHLFNINLLTKLSDVFGVTLQCK